MPLTPDQKNYIADIQMMLERCMSSIEEHFAEVEEGSDEDASLDGIYQSVEDAHELTIDLLEG